MAPPSTILAAVLVAVAVVGATAFSPAAVFKRASAGAAGASRGAANMCMLGGRVDAGAAAEWVKASGGDRRAVLRTGLAAAAAVWAGGIGVPEEAAARKPKQELNITDANGKPYPTISLKDFYEALYAQRVQKVEFDGSMYERAFVLLDNKPEFVLIKEGYPTESSVSSAGPQQVLGKIRNEIKAGNPVTWEWRFANTFKKKKEVEGEGAKKAVTGGEAGAAKSGDANKGEGKDKKAEEKKGGSFPFSLPAPPKSL